MAFCWQSAFAVLVSSFTPKALSFPSLPSELTREYEKIREANIREKEQLLRSLQGDWREFNESEGLAVGGS